MQTMALCTLMPLEPVILIPSAQLASTPPVPLPNHWITQTMR